MAYGTRPTIRSSLLGRKLKRAREAAGFTSASDVAAKLGRAASTVYRNESGHTPPRGNALRGYIKLYEPDFTARRQEFIRQKVARFDGGLGGLDEQHASDDQRTAIQTVRQTIEEQAAAQADEWVRQQKEEWEREVARWKLLSVESSEGSAWAESGKIVGPSHQDFAEAEAMADDIRTWSAQVVPGLLQTTEYSQCAIKPAAEVDPNYPLSDALRHREQRKGLLARPRRPRIHAVMDEGALRRIVGGPRVMENQLVHLVNLALTDEVRIQVLPFEVGAHNGMGGSFDLFSFGSDMMAFREGHGDGTFIDDPAQIELYQVRFRLLQDRAWSPEKTLGYLHDALANGVSARTVEEEAP
ncbi:transcriptional regulator with XRE-family HTH domain [Streptomyces sp. V3I8]|uniref:helix-turn-helix domain-containing protein n=1 Tax=Streptomyces sp. V3I8 TaxID=3042279 RepID=UPI00278365BD|nr:helix-turn-helix transcriptional regulator [Streptomyces sp. V3I8]MDQ1041496.1 transcriptional regulator with XRE-family HTH domain [Streptomyces sp. V3I8]